MSVPSHDSHAMATPAARLRCLSEEQLQQLGLAQLAYVRPILMNGEPAFAIHAADGTPMALAGDRDVAIAAIEQQELVAASVH